MSELDGILGYCTACKFYARDGERAFWGDCTRNGKDTSDWERCKHFAVGEAQLKDAQDRARRALFAEMGE